LPRANRLARRFGRSRHDKRCAGVVHAAVGVAAANLGRSVALTFLSWWWCGRICWCKCLIRR